MSILAFAALAVLVIGGTAVSGFVVLERRGAGWAVVAAILLLLCVEVTLFENQDRMLPGLFHPGSGAISFRLPELLLTLALVARLVARGAPRRAGVTGMLWAAFAVWLVAAAVTGILRHNDSTELFYQTKAIIYVVGGFALGATVPLRRLLERRHVERFVIGLGATAALFELLTVTGRQFDVAIPLLHMQTLGIVGADAASIFSAVGLLAVVLFAAHGRARPILLLAVIPLLLTTVVAEQRAALLQLAVSMLVLVAAWLGPTARRRLRATGGQVLLAVLGLLALALLSILAPTATSDAKPALPFAHRLQGTLDSTGKRESAQARVNQLHEASRLIRQHPVLGWGLGKTYSYFLPGYNTYTVTPLTHNIGSDLILRTGLIGLLLFAAALAASCLGGVRAWHRHPDDVLAAFALVCVAILIGLTAKGMVESLFEKYRLATFIGLTLGLLRSATTTPSDDDVLIDEPARPMGWGPDDAEWRASVTGDAWLTG